MTTKTASAQRKDTGTPPLDAALKRRVEDALADTAMSISQAQVFADLQAHHEKRRA